MKEKLIDYDVTSILNEFQNQYSASTGSKMLPGSEEFSISSVFSYAIATLVNSMNKSALNRFIDTANGKWLDAIASSLGLSRTAEPKLNAHFVMCTAHSQPLDYMPASGLEIEGMVYKQKLKKYISSEGGSEKHVYVVIYEADKPLNRPSLSHDALNNALKAYAPAAYKDKVEAVGIEYPEGLNEEKGIPVSFPYTEEGDDKFRAYIKDHSNIIAGTAKYYEEMTKDLHPAIGQVRCVRQGEQIYVKGFVRMFYIMKLTFDNVTFKDLPYNVYQVKLDTVNSIAIADVMAEFCNNEKYFVLGAQPSVSEATIKTVYPMVVSTYDKSLFKPIDGSTDWSPKYHSGYWNAAQSHYFLVFLYYMHLTRTMYSTYNTSVLSSMLLKTLDEIDGLEDWVNNGVDVFGNHDAIKKMFICASSAKATLSYRVGGAGSNPLQPEQDVEWKTMNESYQFYTPSLYTTSSTGSQNIEKALVFAG